MSEYQRLKARALELQREKEAELKRELAAKAKRDAQVAREEAERKKRLEEASKEARRKELIAANAAIHASKQSAPISTTYDPFAEDARPGPSKIVPKKPVAKAAVNGKAARSTSNGSGRPPATKAWGEPSNSRNERKVSPPVLGRKEKALQSLKRSSKQSASDSMFSVASLVAAHERSPRASPGPARSSPRKPPALAPRTMPKAPISKKGSMASLKKGVDVNSLRALCPDRETRDRRTIDEIQRDILARRDGGSGVSSPKPPPRREDTRRPDPRRPEPRQPDRRSEPRQPERRPDPRRPESRPDPRRPRRHSSSSDSDSYSSDTPPPRKRPRARTPTLDEPDRATVSALIQGMFSRGRQPRQYDDDSDVSDMEAGLDDVLREERRAAAIARREDEEALREEEAHRAAKERLKRQRMKGK